MSPSLSDPGHEPLVLVSHALCPYVQRAAIVMDEKGVAFVRRDIDLADKPGWFLAISPLGKTPVLLVDGTPIFESAVICEYLDESFGPHLHPTDALERARHRSWIEFGSQVLAGIGAFYRRTGRRSARGRAGRPGGALRPGRGGARRRAVLRGRRVLHRRRRVRTGVPLFRRLRPDRRLRDLRRPSSVRAWRRALASRPSVRRAVSPSYPELLGRFLERRGSALSQRMAPAVA
jgi:glutathione S-transferase